MSKTYLTPSEHNELCEKVNRYLATSGMDAVISWSALMTYLKELKDKRKRK